MRVIKRCIGCNSVCILNIHAYTKDSWNCKRESIGRTTRGGREGGGARERARGAVEPRIITMNQRLPSHETLRGEVDRIIEMKE